MGNAAFERLDVFACFAPDDHVATSIPDDRGMRFVVFFVGQRLNLITNN